MGCSRGEVGTRSRSGRMAKVARVIVGEPNGIEVTAKIRDRPGIGPECELLVEPCAAVGDQAFEITDREIGLLEQASDARERVAAGEHGPAGVAVEYDVADEGHANLLRSR